jgi:hypothetical protein
LVFGLAACSHRRGVGVDDLESTLAFIQDVHPNPSEVDLEAARAAMGAEAGQRDPAAPPSFAMRVRGATLTTGALGDAHVVVGTPPRS